MHLNILSVMFALQVTIHQADHTCGVLALATCGDFLVSGSDGGIKVPWRTVSTVSIRRKRRDRSHPTQAYPGGVGVLAF